MHILQQAAIWLVCLFTFSAAAHAQTTDAAPTMREYREASFGKRDEAAVRAICDSWIKTGKATNNPGLTAQGIARQASADAKFATIPFEERRAAFDKALDMLPPGTSTYRANVLIAAGAHNGSYGDDLEGGLELAEQGLLMARGLEDDTLLSEGYAAACQTLRFLNRTNRALDYALRSLRYAEAAGDEFLLNYAVLRVWLAGMQMGHEDQSVELVRKYVDRLPESLRRSFLAHHGSSEEMRDVVPELLALLHDESASQSQRAYAGQDAAQALIKLGRAEESLPIMAMALKIIEGADPTTEATLASEQVQIMIEVGQLEQAVALGDNAIEALSELGRTRQSRDLAKSLSKAHRELGNNEKAGQLTELADNLADDLLVSAFEQTRDSAEQSWYFDVQSRQQAEKIREQERETRLREAQLRRLQTIAWGIPLLGLILWGGFRLRQTRKQRTELAKQVALKTSSLTAATLDAREQKSRAENLHEKLENVLRTSSIGIWEWSFEEEKLVWDEQMFKIYGVDPKDFEGAYTDWSDRLHPEDFLRATTIDNCRLEVEGGTAVEFRIVRPSGEIRHIYANVYQEKDGHGKPIRSTGVNMDITERRTAELALLASEETYKQLVEEVAEVIWSTTSDGIITYLSPQYMKLVGYAPEEQIGNSCLNLVHPDDQPKINKSIALLREAPDKPRTDEFRLRHRNGHYVWTAGTVRAVCDEKGHPVRIHGILRDIHDRRVAEIALAETEGKFQRIADNVPGMVYRYVIHPDGTDELTYVSSGSREVFEIEPQETLERGIKTVWERIHEEDRDWVKEEIAKSGKNLEPYQFEYRLVLPEKGPRWVQSFAQPIRATNGDLIWDGITLDLTDRKEAELELKNTRLQLESLAANVPGMIWRMEAKDGVGTITYLSSKSREMFEVEPEEAVADNHTLHKYVHPEDLARYRAGQKTAIENVESFSLEFRVNLPKQGQRWRQCSAHPVKNEMGEFVWNGMTIDITDRKIAELALQEAQHQIQRITANVPGMIYRFVFPAGGEPSHNATFVSSKSHDMFGVSPAKAIEDATSLWKWIHPDDLARLRNKVVSSVRELTPLKAEYRVETPNGETRWHEVNGQPVRLDNGDVTLDGVTLDVTDRKEAELANDVLAQATKTKDEFLANMSHELRTPLTAILGMTEGIQQGLYGETTPRQVETLRIVEESGLHLLDLINEILDLAKIDAGKTNLMFSSVNVSKVCDSCLHLVAPQAEKKNIQLSLNVSRDLDSFAADETRLRQVLVNLLGNAVKFTPENGTVQLEVKEVAADKALINAQALRFVVSDSGIGIEPDRVESLFQPFVQVDSSLSRQYEGSGLGLTLVKRFVELHHGQIRVESEPSNGSRFIVDLPFRVAKTSADIAESTFKTSQNRPAPRGSEQELDLKNASRESLPRILLAEDNEHVALAIKTILEASGFRCLHVANGKQAIEYTKQHSPDLILMDIQMPVMDGLEAIRQIRRLPHSAVPIIALSGFAMAEDTHRCIDAGANLFVSKPCKFPFLVATIRELLGAEAMVEGQAGVQDPPLENARYQ